MDTNRHECVRSSAPRYAFSVAQICNLLYRRIAFCGTSASPGAFELSDALPIINRRYGRLQICATKPRCAPNTYSPEAMNVNSPGCNPGCVRFVQVPTPKGSNRILFSVSSVRPLRGRDRFANHYPGFYPGLFALQPSGLANRVNSWSVRGSKFSLNSQLTKPATNIWHNQQLE
jgi:hypothetical protein